MLYINDKIRVKELDDKNLIVELQKDVINPKTKENRQKWTFQGYYANLESALKYGVLNILLREDIKEDLGVEELLKKIESTKKDIIKALNQ